MSLRILHVIRSDKFAGVEQFVRRLAVAQVASGHRVAVIGGAPDHMAPVLAAAGIPYRAARTTAQVARLVNAHARDVDVVNTHMTAADVGAVLANLFRRDRPAIVATRHFALPRGHVGPSFVYRLIETRIDKEISISRSVAGATAVPSVVVHPGVDPVKHRDPVQRRETVLIAQRLQPEKHTPIGVRAFAASGLPAQGWQLQIAGDGPQRAELETLATSLGIGAAVRFLGFRTDVPGLMATSGMLLATSPFEHFGLTVLEAMANELPVVATRSGGHAEMLAGLDERALFTPDDVAGAAAALRALAEDRVGRLAYAVAARDRQVSDFSLGAQVAATDRVYRDAVAARSHRRRGSGR